ncbi:hypothetical protein AAMO2058_000535400 [Amorphochlora amoebiformis]
MDKVSPEYNYVVTAHRPTAVTHALTCSFTGSSDRNLILAKSTYIEVKLITSEGLLPLIDIPLYGRIASMLAFRPSRSAKRDQIFICTERHGICVLEYDPVSRKIVTKMSGSARQRSCRPVESEDGPLGLLDPDHGIIGLYLFEGIFQYLKINPRDGKMSSRPFKMRLEELKVISMCFLKGQSKPALAVLYSDSQNLVFLKTYAINLREESLERGPWREIVAVETGASKLIPMGRPFGGVLVIGSESIAYIDSKRRIDTKINATRIECWGAIDRDRFLFGDIDGKLMMAIIRHDGKEVRGLQIEEHLGITTKASTLTYLDNAYAFVGSVAGDSQLIQLLSEKSDETGSYLREVERYINLGPILDFCVVDLDRQGQGMMVTCSGAGKDGSLRAVRNGIGITPDATLDVVGLQGMWSIKSEDKSRYHQFMVLAFASQTYALVVSEIKEMDIDADDEKGTKSSTQLAPTEIAGFDHLSTTLFAGNMKGDFILQVTPFEARLVACVDLKLRSTWRPPKNTRILKAYGQEDILLLATTANHLAVIKIDQNNLKELNSTQLTSEVSSLVLWTSQTHLAPSSVSVSEETNGEMVLEEDKNQTVAGVMELDGKTDTAPYSGSTCLAAVGLWDSKGVIILEIPTLKVRARESLGGLSIARSLAFCPLDSILRLFCGMGDGRLITFEVRSHAKLGLTLSSPKKVAIGTHPVSLTCFENEKNGWHVMACCDRPTVVYCAKNSPRLLYNNVNLKHARHMVKFRTPSAPDALAFATQDSLIIGTADAMQKLHVSTIPLGEQPRRITHQAETDSFLVCVESVKSNERNKLRIANGQTFEWIATITLEENEVAVSCLSMGFKVDPTPYYCVGTAFILPEEDEPTKGRVLIVEFNPIQNAARILSEVITKGTVYCLDNLNGKLLAGINSHVQLFQWDAPRSKDSKIESKFANFHESKKSAAKLVPVCLHRGHIVALCLSTYGDFFVVGDLMRSVALLMYQEETKSIVEVARDYANNWMTAVTMLDNRVFLGTEDRFHLFSLKRNLASGSDDHRLALLTVGKFHLGEFVNRFRKGSLVMQTPESKASSIPSQLFGTVNGLVGVVASLSKRQYLFLKKLESAIHQVVQGVGGLSHREFRSYLDEGKSALKESKNFIDGDLIEKFLSLAPTHMKKVADLIKTNVETVLRHVETAARVH